MTTATEMALLSDAPISKYNASVRIVLDFQLVDEQKNPLYASDNGTWHTTWTDFWR